MVDELLRVLRATIGPKEVFIVRKTVLLGCLVAALGLVVAGALMIPARGDAQAASGASSAVAPGPGGMWVVSGGRVYVCALGVTAASARPPTPVCGAPATLP